MLALCTCTGWAGCAEFSVCICSSKASCCALHSVIGIVLSEFHTTRNIFPQYADIAIVVENQVAIGQIVQASSEVGRRAAGSVLLVMMGCMSFLLGLFLNSGKACAIGIKRGICEFDG